jgi:hypothetical protein
MIAFTAVSRSIYPIYLNTPPLPAAATIAPDLKRIKRTVYLHSIISNTTRCEPTSARSVEPACSPSLQSHDRPLYPQPHDVTFAVATVEHEVG